MALSRALLLLIGATLLMSGVGPVSAHCSPPCGPIPAIIEFNLDRVRDLTFGEGTEVVLKGNISYYLDVDFNGYFADPQENPELTLFATRKPAWMDVKVEPARFIVPLNDPSYLRAKGPEQVEFFWDAAVTVTVSKLRDPTLEELGPKSREVRRDGSARALIVGTSTSSYLGSEVLGNTLGVQEGYGARELRFIPEKDGIPYLPDAKGVLRPGTVTPLSSEAAPAVGIAALGALGLAWVLRRR